MSVVSRNAVPLLPMQLARSFAVRTESEVLRYLANAQFLGLAGLWQKLCAGQLPARCDKAWYFATFCGIDGAEFARRELAELDETADILTHLNGFVKPYDVLAAMTVLPATSKWFSRNAEVVVNGTSHRLLLGTEHAMDVRSVHNLLRETYHSVALLDADVANGFDRCCANAWCSPLFTARGLAAVARPARAALVGCWLGPRARSSARAATHSQLRAATLEWRTPQFGAPRRSAARGVTAELPPMRLSAASLPRGSGAARGSKGDASACCARQARCVPLGVRPSSASSASGGGGSGGGGGAHSRNEALLWQLQTERLRSADGAAPHALAAKLLGTSLAEARARQVVVMKRVGAAAIVMCACTMVAFLLLTFMSKSGAGDAGDEEWAALRASIVFDRTRDLVIALTFGATTNLIVLALELHVIARDARSVTWLRANGAFGLVIICGTAVPPITRLMRYLPAVAASVRVGRTPALWLVLSSTASCFQLVVHVCAAVLNVGAAVRARADQLRALAMFRHGLCVLFAGSTVTHFLLFLRHALDGGFARRIAPAATAAATGDGDGDGDGLGHGGALFALALLAFLPVPAFALGARRISRAVETASFAAFNDVVRALFPAVRDELARMAVAAEANAEDEDDEWLMLAL
ncbi:hypothetical protein KFE25_010414 [Diacronema lutheri]|nr:hypothetical protein KFE25_010414 [Diacronema lutheri]